MSAIGCWPIDRPFPICLRDRDLMLVVGLKHSRFYLLKASGEFDFLKVRPQPKRGGTLYSGELVRRWARNELGESRFFQGARRSA